MKIRILQTKKKEYQSYAPEYFYILPILSWSRYIKKSSIFFGWLAFVIAFEWGEE